MEPTNFSLYLSGGIQLINTLILLAIIGLIIGFILLGYKTLIRKFKAQKTNQMTAKENETN